MQINAFGKSFKLKEWEGETLLKEVVLDTETRLIESPSDIPDLVITTIYDGSNTVYWCRNSNVLTLLESLKNHTVIFHNAAFDIPVLEKASGVSFHAQIIGNKIFDTALLYRLFHIASKGMEPERWALDYLVESYLGVKLEKNEEIRLTFGQYLNADKTVKYSAMGEAHLKYACLDAIATRIIYQILLKQFQDIPTETFSAHQIQLMGDIALAQITRNGIGVDLEYVNKSREEFNEKEKRPAEIMAVYGVVRGKGFETLYETAIKFLNLDLPVTKSGKLSSAEEDLIVYDHIPFVKAFLDFKEVKKQQDFLNDLTASRVYPRYNSLKNTSRTSCSKPNVQNMPRSGGVREAFIPAPGHVFLDIDYTAIELAAIASITQKLFKHSVMADKINADIDLHKYTASQIFKIDQSEVTKDQRQLAKALNFGLVANMAPETFCQQAKATYGVIVTPEEAKILKEQWANIFPEMKKYWKWGYGKNTVITHTGFTVANCRYTQFLNYHMQSRVAQGAKIMLYALYRSPYKVVAFIHDAVLVEIEKEKAEEALSHVSKIMIDTMSTVITGVKVKVEGAIKDRFTK